MDLHYLIAHHFLEYLIAISSFAVVLTRFKNELRVVYYFFNALILLAEMAKIYFRYHPDGNKKFQTFLFSIMNHYLKTHPAGKEISKNTNLDEKITKYMVKHDLLKHDSEVEGIG